MMEPSFWHSIESACTWQTLFSFLLPPSFPLPILISSCFLFFQERKRAECRVAVLWIWCALLLTFILCACVTICILIFLLHFLLANYPAFPSVYLCRCSCIPFLFCWFYLSVFKAHAPHPPLGRSRALWLVSPPAFPLGKLWVQDDFPHGGCPLFRVGSWGWGLRAPPSQLWGPPLARRAWRSPTSTADPCGGLGNMQVAFLVTAGEVKTDLTQTCCQRCSPTAHLTRCFLKKLVSLCWS